MTLKLQLREQTLGILQQTTPFGEALPSKNYFVYKSPADTYQKFVEVFASSISGKSIRGRAQRSSGEYQLEWSPCA